MICLVYGLLVTILSGADDYEDKPKPDGDDAPFPDIFPSSINNFKVSRRNSINSIYTLLNTSERQPHFYFDWHQFSQIYRKAP